MRPKGFRRAVRLTHAAEPCSWSYIESDQLSSCNYFDAIARCALSDLETPKRVFGVESCRAIAGTRRQTGYCGWVAAKAAGDVDIALPHP
jgi:hypothetical protein